MKPFPARQNIVKNQHYIPEGLLCNFAKSDGKLFEILLDASGKKIYATNPGNSMCEKFTYEHKFLEKNCLEKYFARLDGSIVPDIKKLIALIEQYKAGKIEWKQVKESVERLLFIFVTFYYRSGALLQEFGSFHREERVPLLTRKIFNFDYLQRLAGTLRDFYKFAIIESDGDFLLSDQFVSTASIKLKSRFFEISDRHIGLRDTLVLVPISSRFYVAYWHATQPFFIKENQLQMLTDAEVRLINGAIINNSYKKCVAQKKERIEEVVDEYKWASPTQTFAGGNPEGFVMGAIKKKEVFLFEEDRKAFGLLESMNIRLYKKLGRNDQCACKSGKKFKHCHQNAYEKIKVVVQGFGKSDGQAAQEYIIPEIRTVELPVYSWSKYSPPKSDGQNDIYRVK
jgi:hypothetical protein